MISCWKIRSIFILVNRYQFTNSFSVCTIGFHITSNLIVNSWWTFSKNSIWPITFTKFKWCFVKLTCYIILSNSREFYFFTIRIRSIHFTKKVLSSKITLHLLVKSLFFILLLKIIIWWWYLCTVWSLLSIAKWILRIFWFALFIRWLIDIPTILVNFFLWFYSIWNWIFWKTCLKFYSLLLEFQTYWLYNYLEKGMLYLSNKEIHFFKYLCQFLY